MFSGTYFLNSEMLEDFRENLDESLSLASKNVRRYLYFSIGHFPIGAKMKIKQPIADMSIA
jgi:hypothetical protein